MKRLCFLLLLSVPSIVNTAATDTANKEGAGLLLSRIDLSRPGLEIVNKALPDTLAAAEELLKYYRSRNWIKHPVDRSLKPSMLGKAATENDLKAAENALKHIFVGQSAYPPFFCGDDINWGLRPVPDNEWVWQLNRMGFWQSMSLAYWHTGDEKYAREWCFQLMDWTRKNPRDKEHAYAWRSIEAGIRGHNWMNLFHRFIDSPHFTAEVLVEFLNSCYDHASFLMTRYSKGSNWALMEAEGMAHIAMIFPEFRESVKWRDEAISRLNREINSQVYPDGHQRELAMGYHIGCIGWFTRTYDLAAMNGLTGVFSPSYQKMIEKMCEVPMKLGLPDGSSTQFGDSWRGSSGQLWRNLKGWAETYRRNDFLYVATEGKEGKEPDSTAYALPHSGFYSMRSGWDRNATCMIVKCGPDGGGHCQPDNGSFELYAGGRDLMPDAGCYIYSGDPGNRAWFRQTKVHQTLTLNGANTAYAPKLLLWKPGKKLDILVFENAGYKDLTHRRAVLFVDKKYFIIVDEATGSASGEVDVHFQLSPGNAVYDNEKLTVRSDFKEGWNVLVKPLNQEKLGLAREEGQISYQYTKKQPRPAFRYGLIKNANDEGVRFITLLVPYSGEVPDADIRLAENTYPGSDRMELLVRFNGKTRKVSYDLTAKRKI